MSAVWSRFREREREKRERDFGESMMMGELRCGGDDEDRGSEMGKKKLGLEVVLLSRGRRKETRMSIIIRCDLVCWNYLQSISVLESCDDGIRLQREWTCTEHVKRSDACSFLVMSVAIRTY